jgi:hypothetical protein
VALQPTERDQQGSRTPGAENGADKNLDIFHGGYCGLVFDGCRAERGALGTFHRYPALVLLCTLLGLGYGQHHNLLFSPIPDTPPLLRFLYGVEP